MKEKIYFIRLQCYSMEELGIFYIVNAYSNNALNYLTKEIYETVTIWTNNMKNAKV